MVEQRVLLDVDLLSQLGLIRRVDQSEVAAQRGVGGEDHAVGIILRDGELGAIEGLVEAVGAEADIAEELEAVDGVAEEGHAVVAGRESELLVQLEESAQQADLHAGLALHPRRVGQAQLEHAADTGIEQFYLRVDEAADLDVQAQLGRQVGIDLAHGIPAVLAHRRAGVDADGIRAVVDERGVESGHALEAAVEQSEVETDVAPCAGADHDAAVDVALLQQVLHGLRARALRLLQVGVHVGVGVLVSAEELLYLLRDGGQGAVVGQLIAEA